MGKKEGKDGASGEGKRRKEGTERWKGKAGGERKKIEIHIPVASSANFWALQKSISITVSTTLLMRVGLDLS